MFGFYILISTKIFDLLLNPSNLSFHSKLLFHSKFILKFISFIDLDIDECHEGTANCGPDEICKNKPGGYTCSCPAGHALNAQRRCEDVDECDFYKGQVKMNSDNFLFNSNRIQ